MLDPRPRAMSREWFYSVLQKNVIGNSALLGHAGVGSPNLRAVPNVDYGDLEMLELRKLHFW